MSAALLPCRRCARHVRRGEAECPFCGSPIASMPPRSFAVPMIVAAAGAALTLAGCDGAIVSSAQADEGDEPVRMTPQYGAPSYDPEPPPPQQGPQPPPPVDAG